MASHLVSCRSGDGPGRYLLTSFDHLVTDGYSQARLVDELLGAADGNGGGGSFREWVEWQRGEYPDPRSETSGAFSFWERYLDGTVPDRSAGLTFATGDDGALTGQVHTVRRTLPVSAQTLTRAAARGRMTPFVLFLGIATHAATRFTPTRTSPSGSTPWAGLRVSSTPTATSRTTSRSGSPATSWVTRSLRCARLVARG